MSDSFHRKTMENLKKEWRLDQLIMLKDYKTWWVGRVLSHRRYFVVVVLVEILLLFMRLNQF